MNCPYCHQTADYVEEHSRGTPVWICRNHPCEVFFVQDINDPEPCVTNFRVSYKGRTYNVLMYQAFYFNDIVRDVTDPPTAHFDIDEDGMERIMSTTHLPHNLTPENVLEKLPLWLVFS
jgi:hypothetical protein